METFEQFVDEVFKEHHNCMGMDAEEIEELIDDSTFDQRRKWLIKEGYNLRGDYHASMGA